jgi:ABC-type polysaccharide/polyol phosphate export permease
MARVERRAIRGQLSRRYDLTSPYNRELVVARWASTRTYPSRAWTPRQERMPRDGALGRNPEMRAFVADCREMLLEQLEYRELLYQMVKRDLLVRYKQSIMGFGWAVFMPLINTAVFATIFNRVVSIDTPVPYPVFAYCGLWVWNLFASALRLSVVSVTSNTNLVTKVFFPREIFPFASVIVSLVDFAVGAILLVLLMAWYHIAPAASLIWLPVVIAVHVAFTSAVALLLAMGNLFYRDVKYLFEVLITVWMFGTSVVYPLDRIGGKLGIVLSMNPMTGIVDSYRAVLLLGSAPPPALATAGLVSAVTLALSWFAFHRAEFRFAEIV